MDEYPRILICEDAAYHHLPFGYEPFKYPRCISHPRLSGKTVCVASAGKMLSATGMRVGFAFGNEQIVKAIKVA